MLVESDDSIPEAKNVTYTYNLPCKVCHIHQELPGRALLLLWLHGGVSDQKLHSLKEMNHLDCTDADERILDYLNRKGLKAIVLFPICYKANISHCIAWRDCYDDVMQIMDNYIQQEMVDTRRIYIAGASDGGRGTWDYIERNGAMFAAAMPMSCAQPRYVGKIPVYFFNTASESDCRNSVESLNARGANIRYKRCADVRHGLDSKEITDGLLDDFFSQK